MRLFLAVVIGLAAVAYPVARPGSGAQTGDSATPESATTDCGAPIKTELDPKYRIDTLAHNPLPLEGQFPDDPPLEPGDAVMYDVTVFDSAIDPRAPTLALNGTAWVLAGIYFQERVEELPPADASEHESVVNFLTLWSKCSQENTGFALFGLMTDFGFGWVCSPGDPFMALRSPASGLCPGGSLSQTQGALPLHLYDARYLSANRVGIVVGDGSYRDENGEAAERFVMGSVWVLVKTADGWSVDAIVGLVQIPSHLAWIEIPVG